MKTSTTPSTFSTFTSRAELYLQQAAAAAETWYDAKGQWVLTSTPPEVRERYWICCALYVQGKQALADAIVLAGDTKQPHMEWGNPSSFDIFHTNIACVLLLLFRERMSATVRQKLEELVLEGFDITLGNRRPDHQFHGANDNMKAKATMGLILGGEMLDDATAVAHGLWNLRQLRNMLIRRGTHSEWNSPTYTPSTIAAIAKTAHYTRNPEVRELAAAIEERLWLDLAARFHAEIGVIAGPYSRAYTVDAIAHASAVSTMLWFLLGDIAHPSPMELFNPRTRLVLHHMGDLPFNIAEKCWFATGPYHPSARALDLFLHKTYPFHAMAVAEMSDGGPDYPARPVRLESFLERDYTVGTSTTPFSGGEQSEPYFVTYRRTLAVKSFMEVGTVYHKFAINDEVPGMITVATGPDGRPYSNSGEGGLLNSRCGVQTLQSKNTALVLTHPQLSLGGLEELRAPSQLSLLNELIVFPSHFGGAEEIQVGNRAFASWSGEAARGEWIGCRAGRLLIAFRPMVYSRSFGPARTTLEKINHYEVLRSTLYHGEPRVFARSELRNIFGGFVAEHASVDDYPSLAAFLDEVSKSSFSDYFWMTRRTRYRRAAGKVRPALELEISWSPGSQQPRHALINGRLVSWDTRVQIDGLKDADFPLLQEPWKSVPSYFPWKNSRPIGGQAVRKALSGIEEQD